MFFSRLSVAAASLIAFALVIAGCGGSSSSPYSSSQPSSTTASNTAGSGAETIAAAGNSELGTLLVDSKGFTVYNFAKDRGMTSSCYGACAEFWPPVTTEGAPTSGEGAQASKLGTTKRKDGTVQVTYAGKPLYTFAEDEQPGEASGNGITAFGAVWNAVTPSGTVVASASAGEAESGTAAQTESGGESSGGRYGY
jgi:predicted lipoprotein with Yx(FWY)xxD motif